MIQIILAVADRQQEEDRTMAARPAREMEPLPSRHPCLACEARARAACAVLDAVHLAELKKLGPTLKLAAGQTLFREGDTATRVFTLTRGSLKLYKLLPDGRRHVVAFIFPGEFLGVTANQEHAFTAELLEDSTLCSFPRTRFASFLAEHPPMVRELYQIAAHELRAAQQHLVLLGRKTAAERLATFLLRLADGAGQAVGTNSRTVRLPMNRADIADHLGLTKETVSRILSMFRAARLIQLRAVNEVELVDRARLELVAECEAAA